jgi:N-acetylmuramoyl-L-alanine amidase CwlA
MNKYNIPKENVIRHYDVTGKLCPAYWSGTTEKDAKWKTEFWNNLATGAFGRVAASLFTGLAGAAAATTPSSTSTPTPSSTSTTLNISTADLAALNTASFTYSENRNAPAIQIKRGTADLWSDKNPVLAPGQPGYDRTNNKLKIGNGIDTWSNLNYLNAGYDWQDFFTYTADSSNESGALFTVGTEPPDENTKGPIYLQEYDGAVEVDYVTNFGRDSTYFYRQWNTGFMECWGKGSDIPVSIYNKFTTIVYQVKTGDYYEVKGYWK